MREFNDLYRPHAAWEDTVLLPAFRKIVTLREIEALGIWWQREADEVLGGNSFERIAAQEGRLEARLGLDAPWTRRAREGRP